MDFQVGDENPLTPDIDAHATALTQLESSAQEIHKSLNAILDYQTHHRLVSIVVNFIGNFAPTQLIELSNTKNGD